jgi:hypothetical protein
LLELSSMDKQTSLKLNSKKYPSMELICSD